MGMIVGTRVGRGGFVGEPVGTGGNVGLLVAVGARETVGGGVFIGDARSAAMLLAASKPKVNKTL